MPLRRAKTCPPRRERALGRLLRRRFTHEVSCVNCGAPCAGETAGERSAKGGLPCTNCGGVHCRRCLAARVQRVCVCERIAFAQCRRCGSDQALPICAIERALVDSVLATGNIFRVYDGCMGGKVTLVTPYDLDENEFKLHAFPRDLRVYRELACC